MKRAIRRINKRLRIKRNIKRMEQEPFMGRTRYPLEMCSYIPSWFKTIRKRARRSKEKQALRIGKEVPLFKKDDEWEWW